MKKTITINLPEPCHEDWGKMTPTEKGRFCSSCEKEVVDFSKKTNEELVKELAGKTNLCGRFKSSQVNRPITLERKSSIGLLPYAASLMLPLSLMGSNPSHNSVEDKNFTSLGIGRYSNSNSERYQVTTTGKITDANGKPIFNVEIRSKESQNSELSGMRGDYEIKSYDRDVLLFEKEGFVSQEVKLGSKSGTLNITLQKAPAEFPAVMVVGGIGMVKEIETDSEISQVKDVTVCSLNEEEELIEGEIIAEEFVSEEKETDDEAIKIRGTVVDEYNIPLPGANVVIKGTTIGAQTDFDGNFEISVDEGQELVFSYVGFKTQELRVSKGQPVNVTMVMEEMILGGFVGGIVITEVRGVNLNNSKYVVESEEYPVSEYTLFTDQDRKQWRENNKKAQANELEFKRIKMARKKAARKLKNTKRRKK